MSSRFELPTIPTQDSANPVQAPKCRLLRANPVDKPELRGSRACATPPFNIRVPAVHRRRAVERRSQNRRADNRRGILIAAAISGINAGPFAMCDRRLGIVEAVRSGNAKDGILMTIAQLTSSIV